MANANWLKIKNEYLSTGISYRKLAEKHKVSFNTLKDRATREKWSDSRSDAHHKITTKAQQKTAEKIAEQEADYIINFAQINHRLAKKVFDMADDADTPKDIKLLTGALKDIKDIRIGSVSIEVHSKTSETIAEIEAHIVKRRRE